MGGYVSPLAALAAESVWSPGLLEGADLVAASEESGPPLEEASPITAATTEEEPSLFA